MQLRNGKITNNLPTRKRKVPAETRSPIIGYKKSYDNKLVILEIPVWARHNIDRENVFDKQYAKHRCSAALVKEIIDLNTGENVSEAKSIQDSNFFYSVGKTVRPFNGFNESLNEVCAGGIHFFLDRETAVFYGDDRKNSSDYVFRGRHDDGRLSRQYSVVGGKRHGEYRSWYSSGLLREVSFYNKGLLEGLTYYFFDSGQISAIVSCKNGILHGEYKSWHRQGQMDETGSYNNGNRCGVWKKWNEKGDITLENY